MTRPEQPQVAPPAQVRLGIWGPPASGKTTYLAALKIATIVSDLPGNWIMNGADDASSEFLRRSTDLLVEQRMFPGATEMGSQPSMVFRFTGEQPRPTRWPALRRSAPDRCAFDLEVLDVSGFTFGLDASMGSSGASETPAIELAGGMTIDSFGDDLADSQLIDHLQMCQGIVYLFDPEQDARQATAFKFFQSTLERLSARIFQGAYPGSRLPHWVAVCVTKFDRPGVYRRARNGGYTSIDPAPPYFPRVESWAAAEFFEKLCREGNSSTELVASSLRKHFFAERVEYFVTSSVGFYVEKDRFRMDDFDNTERRSRTDFRIRGRVHPVNILEPLIWLYGNVRRSR